MASEINMCQRTETLTCYERYKYMCLGLSMDKPFQLSPSVTVTPVIVIEDSGEEKENVSKEVNRLKNDFKSNIFGKDVCSVTSKSKPPEKGTITTVKSLVKVTPKRISSKGVKRAASQIGNNDEILSIAKKKRMDKKSTPEAAISNTVKINNISSTSSRNCYQSNSGYSVSYDNNSNTMFGCNFNTDADKMINLQRRMVFKKRNLTSEEAYLEAERIFTKISTERKKDTAISYPKINDGVHEPTGEMQVVLNNLRFKTTSIHLASMYCVVLLKCNDIHYMTNVCVARIRVGKGHIYCTFEGCYTFKNLGKDFRIEMEMYGLDLFVYKPHVLTPIGKTTITRKNVNKGKFKIKNELGDDFSKFTLKASIRTNVPPYEKKAKKQIHKSVLDSN
ncbi:hypothetical protein GWI33_007963, partial [Rhynchophorus ferrugineus]